MPGGAHAWVPGGISQFLAGLSKTAIPCWARLSGEASGEALGAAGTIGRAPQAGIDGRH